MKIYFRIKRFLMKVIMKFYGSLSNVSLASEHFVQCNGTLGTMKGNQFTFIRGNQFTFIK